MGIALFVAAVVTPGVRHLALALGAVDAPGLRRVHTARIPRMGGIAIVVAYAVSLMVCWKLSFFFLEGPQRYRLFGLVAGAAVIFVLGLVDDLRGLRSWEKLAGQVFAAVLVWSFGVRINPVLVFPGVGPVDLGIVFSLLATLAWILAITNAINLIDGLDGLAGGVVFFAAVTNVVVAFLTGNEVGIALNAALAGAVLGFLFYNFNPARIFMGDTGSLFLGFTLSASALLTSRQKESTLASLLVPLIALGLPLTDTLLAMARRFVARRSIFSADREHLHHRLLDLGLTHRRAVLVLYGCSVALCVASVAAVLGKDWSVGIALLLALLVIIGIVRFAGSIQLALRQREDRSHLYTAATAAVRTAIPAFAARMKELKDFGAGLDLLDEVLPSEFFPTIRLIEASGQSRWIRQSDAQAAHGRADLTLAHCQYKMGTETDQEGIVLELACRVEGRVPPQLEVLLRVLIDLFEAQVG